MPSNTFLALARWMIAETSEKMKHHIGLTIDSKLFREIEELRRREKRSTFIEHIVRLGLKSYRSENSEIIVRNLDSVT